MRFRSFLLGGLIGVSLGWLLGRLLVPYSGTERRLKMKQRYQDIMDEANKAANAKEVELGQRYLQAKHPTIETGPQI